MASNSSLIPLQHRGELNGFHSLLRKENHEWWGTWQWLVQIIIWLVIVNGMLAIVTLTPPRIEASQASQAASEAQGASPADMAQDAVARAGLMVFFLFSGLAPAVGVIIIGQDTIIEERRTGTAAWVLSKPVSRTAFLLSKFVSNTLGILVTMVLVQGVVAYWIYKAGTGISLPIPAYAAGLGLVYLVLLFYFSLTMMLGVLFSSRGPVVGIPMLLVFGNQLAGLMPWLGKIMPWNLVMDLGPHKPALAVALAQGQPLPEITPILGTVVMTVSFIVIALWRFQKEEF